MARDGALQRLMLLVLLVVFCVVALMMSRFGAPHQLGTTPHLNHAHTLYIRLISRLLGARHIQAAPQLRQVRSFQPLTTVVGGDRSATTYVYSVYTVIIVVVVVLTLTRIIKSVVTGQAPVTLELRNTPGKTHTTQGGTRIYHS